jgi:RNA exonuclease 4
VLAESVGAVSDLSQLVQTWDSNVRGCGDRVCIVDNNGFVLMDTFVVPKEEVTNFRTSASGIRPLDLVGAPPLEEVKKEVAKLVDGRILVGHSLQSGLGVRLWHLWP